jgi:hypothetical protein
MNATRLLTIALLASAMLLHHAKQARAESAPQLPSEVSGLKSERTALLTSILGTTIPIAAGTALALAHDESSTSDGSDDVAAALIFTGVVFGPSMGHFYADRPGKAFAGIGLRTLSIVGLGAAVAASWDSPSDEANAMAIGSLTLGALVAISDIASAPKSARTHNESMEAHRVSVGLGPVGSAPGVRVAVSM